MNATLSYETQPKIVLKLIFYAILIENGKKLVFSFSFSKRYKNRGQICKCHSIKKSW